MMANPNGIQLVMTCSACPEQYDAFYQRRKIGYLRLRHGLFSVEYLPSGKVIFEARPKGDGFFLEEEREAYLSQAKIALANELNKESQ